MSSDSPACHKCGKAWEGVGRLEFRAVCACGAYLHCCLNCRYHDPGAYHGCRASATTEFVADKEKANLCEEFDFSRGNPGGKGPKSRADIEKLFPGLS